MLFSVSYRSTTNKYLKTRGHCWHDMRPTTRLQCLLAHELWRDVKASSKGLHERTPVSAVWCWHCCHPFAGTPIPLPLAYDDRRHVFRTKGTFCSFACAKAYNTDDGGYRSSIAGFLLTLLKKKTTGTLQGIVPAPPRRCLAVFGGSLSIEEFRQKSKDGVILDELPPRVVAFESIIAERHHAAKRARPTPLPDLTTALSFADDAGGPVKNETLRLRRPCPMPSNTNVLARTMGLTVE